MYFVKAANQRGNVILQIDIGKRAKLLYQEYPIELNSNFT